MTSISKMKKHPIDELFHHKLEKYEVEVNEELKARFLAQFDEKEQRTVVPFRWYYAAAAAVFIGLSVGMYFNLPDKNSPTADGITPAGKTTSAPPLASLPEESEPETNDTKSPEPITTAPEKTVLVSKSTALAVNQKPVKTIEIINPTAVAPILTTSDILDEPIPDQLTLALQAAQSKKSDDLKESDGSLFRKSAGETIIILTEDFDKQQAVYLPELDIDSHMTLAEAGEEAERRMDENKPLFGKFLTELKKLKHGEKTDFNSFVASNENGFDEDTFLGHEAEELRQRINWFKGKLSK